MRTLKTALAVTISLCLLSGPSFAQSQCGPRATLLNYLSSEYGESLRVRGIDSGGRLFELFASDENGTWSAVLTTPAGPSCLVGHGNNFEAVVAPVAGDDT